MGCKCGILIANLGSQVAWNKQLPRSGDSFPRCSSAPTCPKDTHMFHTPPPNELLKGQQPFANLDVCTTIHFQPIPWNAPQFLLPINGRKFSTAWETKTTFRKVDAPAPHPEKWYSKTKNDQQKGNLPFFPPGLFTQKIWCQHVSTAPTVAPRLRGRGHPSPHADINGIGHHVHRAAAEPGAGITALPRADADEGSSHKGCVEIGGWP